MKNTFFEDFLEKPEVANITSAKLYISWNYKRGPIIVFRNRFKYLNFKFYVSFIHFRFRPEVSDDNDKP